jgi:DNA-binding CsgD family transcriptional regulator
MEQKTSIEQIFFKFLSDFQFDGKDLDYSVLSHYIKTLQSMAEVSNSGVHVFDLNRKESVFYSSNFGKLLGYNPSDYELQNYRFFESKIHPEERMQLAINGISLLKMFNAFSIDEKLNHKVIDEYRMLNAANKYVRIIEQYQVLALDKKGQIWLMLSIVDISPNQNDTDGAIRCQLLNFRTGNVIPVEIPQKAELALSKRELEILKLVKDGLLSKEISDKLSISVHTVNTHRQRVLEKLDANNSFEAVIFASKFGLLN